MYVNSNFILFGGPGGHISCLTPPPLPCSQLLSINPLITSTALPLPHTKFKSSGSCECSQTGSHPAVIPVRFPVSSPILQYL